MTDQAEAVSPRTVRDQSHSYYGSRSQKERRKRGAISVTLRTEWGSKKDSQEHPAAAQSIDHPIVKDTRPEYSSPDERINVLSLSAINGGDRGDTSQGIYKVYRRFVHRLGEKKKETAVSVRVPGTQRRRKKKGGRGKVRDGTETIRTNRSKFDWTSVK